MNMIHCARIDLGHARAGIQPLGRETLEHGWFGFGALRDLGSGGEDFLALSTGLLTGTGAPGSGGMTWCLRRGGVFQCVPAEGRLGAALRYGGIDHLVFQGASGGPYMLNITVCNGEITLRRTSNRPFMAFKDAWRARPEEDSVIAVVGRNCVAEDNFFAVGSQTVAAALRERGVGSLTVSSSGGLSMADDREFLRKSVELWARRRDVSPAADMEHPAACLSPLPGVRKSDSELLRALEEEDLEGRLLAALGLFRWSEGCAGTLEDAAELAGAYLGRTVGAGDLRNAAAELPWSGKGGGE